MGDDADHAPAKRRNSGASVRLDGNAQAHIGRQLKAMYDDVVKQPIPDRIRELLEQLDKGTSAASGAIKTKGELPN